MVCSVCDPVRQENECESYGCDFWTHKGSCCSFSKWPKTGIPGFQYEEDTQLLLQGDRKQQGLLLLVLLVGAGKGKQKPSRISTQKLSSLQTQPPEKIFTRPLVWLHMSHKGIRAKVTREPSSVGIWFCRVITEETAHLWQKENKKIKSELSKDTCTRMHTTKQLGYWRAPSFQVLSCHLELNPGLRERRGRKRRQCKEEC